MLRVCSSYTIIPFAEKSTRSDKPDSTILVDGTSRGNTNTNRTQTKMPEVSKCYKKVSKRVRMALNTPPPNVPCEQLAMKEVIKLLTTIHKHLATTDVSATG